MSLYDRAAARRDSPFHVQIKLTDLPGAASDDYVRVGGSVVRVFRGGTMLRPGDPVSFRVWVCRKGREPTGPPYVCYEDLVGMGHIEAYLEGEPPGCSLVGYEFSVLPGPSEEPTLRVQELDDAFARFAKSDVCRREPAASKKWWQFWKT